MIKIKTIGKNIIKLKITEPLKSSDFEAITKHVNPILKEYKKARLLIDATVFSGWKNIKACEQHFSFVKAHHMNIERIALIAGYAWQHWVIGAIKIFVHPEIKVFDKDQQEEAKKWVTQ